VLSNTYYYSLFITVYIKTRHFSVRLGLGLPRFLDHLIAPMWGPMSTPSLSRSVAGVSARQCVGGSQCPRQGGRSWVSGSMAGSALAQLARPEASSLWLLCTSMGGVG
ncbi:hypothetical protein ATANTOWER_000289, partial [Ataeniobius toweri]|nr:hypothetical protein [Ataeniobius toweri]